MSLRGPEPLGPEHTVENFDCGSEPLNQWLGRRALANQRSRASRTWAIRDSGRLVGYYASAAASIMRQAATRRAARNQPEDIPAILLARLAVDQSHAGRGLGAELLRHFVLTALAVSELIGARLLLVHAQDQDARRFYLHHDFEPSPIDQLTLMRVINRPHVTQPRFASPRH